MITNENLPKQIQDLLAEAKSLNYQYLLIGGYAIQHYIPTRETKDTDLAIDREQHELWKNLFLKYNYKIEGIHKNFWRYTHPKSEEANIDTLLIDSETFQRMISETKEKTMPLMEHIIALKIFALREDPGLRGYKDLEDIVSLMRIK